MPSQDSAGVDTTMDNTVGSAVDIAIDESLPSPPQDARESHAPSAQSFDMFPPAHLLAVPEPEQSSGTLVLTDSGRSKWLGPTAASDWLKDVCAVAVES